MRLIACLTLVAGLALPGLAAAQSAAAPSVLVRSGQHATFNRLVFDWPNRVPYRISHTPGRATITFERPATLDLSRYRRNPPPLVKSFKPRPDQAGLTVEIEVPQGARLRHFVDAGTNVAVDVYGTAPTAEASRIGQLVAIAAPAVAAAPKPAATIRSAPPEALPTKEPAPQKAQLAQAKSPEPKNSDPGLDYLLQSDEGSSSSRKSGHGFTLGGNISTLGLGGEAGYRFNDFFGVRVGGNYFAFDVEEKFNQTDYDVDFELASAGALLDVHPFGTGFRISGGARWNGNNIDLKATPNGTIDIGGTTFSAAQAGNIEGDIDFNTIAPYAGLGYQARIGGFFSLAFDVGVLFQGDPDVDLDANGALAGDPTLERELDDEADEIADDLNWLGFYPVAAITATVHF